MAACQHVFRSGHRGPKNVRSCLTVDSGWKVQVEHTLLVGFRSDGDVSDLATVRPRDRKGQRKRWWDVTECISNDPRQMDRIARPVDASLGIEHHIVCGRGDASGLLDIVQHPRGFVDSQICQVLGAACRARNRRFWCLRR